MRNRISRPTGNNKKAKSRSQAPQAAAGVRVGLLSGIATTEVENLVLKFIAPHHRDVPKKVPIHVWGTVSERLVRTAKILESPGKVTDPKILELFKKSGRLIRNTGWRLRIARRLRSYSKELAYASEVGLASLGKLHIEPPAMSNN